MQDDELQRLRRQLEAAVGGLPPPAEAIPMLTEIVEPVADDGLAADDEPAGQTAAVGQTEAIVRPETIGNAEPTGESGERQAPGHDAQPSAIEAVVERLLEDPFLLDMAIREAVEVATRDFAKSLHAALEAGLRARLHSGMASLLAQARESVPNDGDAPGGNL